MKSINKLTISAIMAACAATSAYAVPATTKPIMVNQPDGTKIEVYLRGDERGSYFTTLDNVMISRGSNGCFYYTELGNDGKLVASSIRAHNEEERSFEEQAAVSMINGESLLGAFMQNRKLAASKAPSKTMDEGDLTKFPTIGSPRTVVILCEYQDVKFTFTNEDYYDMMNKENYTNDFGAVGSSKDYYMSCSNGQFTPIFDVVGPVTLSKNRMYYGEHTSSQIDIRPKAMIKEAIQLADEICDFSQYDYDGDGYVDNVFVYYAGVGEADSPVSEAIWPHKSELMTPVTCDGKKIVRYACHNELQYNEDEIPRMAGIGGFVHEFTHVLGLPDCYNTVNNDSFANPLTWDVMASGNYNENSHRPPLFSVYQRYFCNWVQPIELKTPTDVSMGYATDPESYDDVYIIKTAKYKEYYLLENRQKEGWDAGLAGNGMLVWHIDYDPVVWKNNEVNDDDTHQRIDIVEAGNKTYSSRLNQKRYPFPGAGKVTSFTDDTTPSMITWTGARLNKPITNIVEKDKTIYFAFMGGAGVDDVRAAGAEVSVGNGVINVNCENGVNVTICDAMGRVVTTGEVAGEHSFSVNPGLYIVRAGNEACKLVVR